MSQAACTKLEITLFLAVCAVAICTDMRTRKIPNWLTSALAVGALALHIPAGWVAVGSAVAAGLIVFALGAVAHSARVLGGGDVKLLAAGALAVGYPDCVTLLLYTGVGGGLLALAFALTQRRLRTTLAKVRGLVTSRTSLDDADPSARMPYAIAISFGAAVVALAHTLLPSLRLPT
jgi:prepilin peptidase CpaA